MHETDATNKQMQQSNRHLSNVYRQRSQHYIGTTHCIHNMAERSYVCRTPFLIMMKMSLEGDYEDDYEDDAEGDYEDDYNGDAGLW